MKVLAVNKFFYIKGGSETYYFGLKKILEDNGHDVIPFSMKDKKNFTTEYEKWFIENISYDKSEGIFKKLKHALSIIYNFDSKRKIGKLIDKEKPDLVHLHLFQHQLSPSILHEIKKKSIPIIYTVHDLKPICLNYKMLTNNKICEDCRGNRYYKCFTNKCVKYSRSKSLINMIEGYVHHILKSYDLIDIYITPSRFYKQKLIENGFPQEKVVYIPNFIDISRITPEYNHDNYYVYIGRLSEEKGIETLIKAFQKTPNANLKIIGTGPMQDYLKNLIIESNIKNIEFMGFKKGIELEKLVKRSKFVIIPSEWYENGPMSVIEAMAYGKPLIGSNIGGIPELIDSTNGYLFRTGDVNDLVAKIKQADGLPDKVISEMGCYSREKVLSMYNEDYHYSQIIKIYNQLLDKK